jgi:hypothetical protein
VNCQAHIQQPQMIQYRASRSDSPTCQREALFNHDGLLLCAIHDKVFRESAVRVYCHGRECWAWPSARWRHCWQCVCCGERVQVAA